MYSLRGSFFSSSVPTKTAIHFITDMEGHISSFVNSIKKSNIVKFDKKNRLHFCNELTKSYFIFGGDLTDRGVGDTQLTEILLDFKLRHPDKVILLVGNREASKTRFFVELNPKYIRERLIYGGAPFWIANPQLPIDYLKKHMKDRNKFSDNLSEIELYVESLAIEECQLIYLKWMLEQNLSCPLTFDFHAQQLAEKLKCETKEITDYMVLKSIMDQTSPTGLMGEYIKQTQIALVIPEAGIMAVHGGLTAENIGRLPTMKQTDSPIQDLHYWIDQFNDWYRTEVAKWSNFTHDNLLLELNPARSTLDTFSLRVPSEYRSIVTASMLDQNRSFTEVPDLISNYLIKNKIKLVLSGHQPCGDYPAILRSKDDQIVFINGDTSYANSNSNPNDTRGQAHHNLEILVNENGMKINIDASLSTGERITNSIEMVDNKVVDCTHIGKILPGNGLVQCFMAENDTYRIIHQEGFKIEYKLKTKSEIDLHYKTGVEKNSFEFL